MKKQKKKKKTMHVGLDHDYEYTDGRKGRIEIIRLLPYGM